MKKFRYDGMLRTAAFVLLGSTILTAECAAQDKNVAFSIANGAIQIKPRLKYELMISIHVLKYAEKCHRLLIPWAEQTRKALSAKTLSEASILIENAHEWQLGSLVQDYEGKDSIEGITQYIKADESKTIRKWADQGWCKPLMGKLHIRPDEFPAWLADFLTRYFREGFGKTWEAEHEKIVYDDAKSTAKELEELQTPIIQFMEKSTGRKFSGATTVILYPSSFSRPSHGYGFREANNKVVVYKAGLGKKSTLGTIYHELLHPLLHGWRNPERMQKVIAELAKQKIFKDSFEKNGKGNYDYPGGWVEELFVHSIAIHMGVKAGLILEKEARDQYYCDYEKAIYDAIFNSYDKFDTIDDFIFHALTEIKTEGVGENVHFVYKP